MTDKNKSRFKNFSLELVVYGAFVVGYFYLVLNYLGDWLVHLFHEQRRLYAVVALALIVGQGIVLETLTRLILGSTKLWRKD